MRLCSARTPWSVACIMMSNGSIWKVWAVSALAWGCRRGNTTDSSASGWTVDEREGLIWIGRVAIQRPVRQSCNSRTLLGLEQQCGIECHQVGREVSGLCDPAQRGSVIHRCQEQPGTQAVDQPPPHGNAT